MHQIWNRFFPLSAGGASSYPRDPLELAEVSREFLDGISCRLGSVPAASP